jgi:hypothetical protein
MEFGDILLGLFLLVIVIVLIVKFSNFRRCHGFNRILKKEYLTKIKEKDLVD